MGSSHSKPKKHHPVRKPQISYPRPHNPSHPHQQTHLHHPLEPQYYGNSPAVHPHPQPRRPARPSSKAKPVSVYAPEVNYYGTFPAAVVARKRVVKAEGNNGMKQQGVVRRKPVPGPPNSRAQVEHYARRGLPPVPGSRAAVRSVKVQYGYC
ncbi:MAG: hypothetical protein LQ339_006492 [Xanthoria mediterranea]|nr:MAG: hypothetical protein LQ339_006492 [Xanthoria mediterranea]